MLMLSGLHHSRPEKWVTVYYQREKSEFFRIGRRTQESSLFDRTPSHVVQDETLHSFSYLPQPNVVTSSLFRPSDRQTQTNHSSLTPS